MLQHVTDRFDIYGTQLLVLSGSKTLDAELQKWNLDFSNTMVCTAYSLAPNPVLQLWS